MPVADWRHGGRRRPSRLPRHGAGGDAPGRRHGASGAQDGDIEEMEKKGRTRDVLELGG
jgi:hypothetical protein